jgi:hypothetical protein
MRLSLRTAIAGLAAGGLATGTPARAADAFYLGSWTIARSVLAPWADPAHPLDKTEPSRLAGKSVAFRPRAISGPQPFACPGPRYKLTSYPADMLFQGAFGELHDKNAKIDPARLAAGLGFTGPKTQTLETGCEFDFHFVDPSTAEVGLNDFIYILKRK